MDEEQIAMDAIERARRAEVRAQRLAAALRRLYRDADRVWIRRGQIDAHGDRDYALLGEAIDLASDALVEVSPDGD